ncbi:hypothetical protein C0991_002539, partial [Blastosporella zonata]
TDEHWLDHDTNLIDEERVLKALETASDYEHGLERFDSQKKALVDKLKELGGDTAAKAIGNKKK